MATVQKYVIIFYNGNGKNTIKCNYMRLKFRANIMTFTYLLLAAANVIPFDLLKWNDLQSGIFFYPWYECLWNQMLLL